LRARDRAAADKFFLEALGVMLREGADPNAILYLGLYLFKPGETVSGSFNDMVVVSYGVNFAACPPPNPALLRPYLRTAAAALTRFAPIPGQPGAEKAVELKRFALLQLLPLYERHQPDLAPAMHAELARLGDAPPWTYTPAQTPSSFSASTDGLDADEAASDIERLKDPRARDQQFFDKARDAMNRERFEQAKTLASRIGQEDLKRQVLELISFNMARKAVGRKDLPEAERIATSQLTQDKRAVIYSLLARAWSEVGEQTRSDQLINEAAVEAGRTDDRAQRARVYLYLAAGVIKSNSERAFELVEKAATEINSIDGFDFNDDGLKFQFRAPKGATQQFTFSPGASLLSLIPALTQADYQRVISIARSMRQDDIRAFTIISSCRTAVARKPEGSKRPPETVRPAGKVRPESIRGSGIASD
jgi:hypothetical protein